MNIEAITIIALLVYLFVSDFYNRKERDALTKKVLAKDLTEYASSEPSQPEKEVKTTFVPLSEVQDEEFEKIMRKQLNKPTFKEKAIERLTSKLKSPDVE